MKTTTEIHAAICQGEQDISPEELRDCIEAQGVMLKFLRQELSILIESIRINDPKPLMQAKANYALGIMRRMDKGSRKPPTVWLGDKLPAGGQEG